MNMLVDLGIIDEYRAHEILGKHFVKITEAIQRGWNDYHCLLEFEPDRCLGFSSTTRANIVHDNIVRHAERIFSGIDDVFCYQQDKIFIIDFHGVIQLRFKKLDISLRPSNILTRQQQEFSSQTLFGPTSTKITAGYRLDNAGIDIRDLHLVCWYNDSLLWNIQLPDSIESVIASDISEPVSELATEIIAKTKASSTKEAKRA